MVEDEQNSYLDLLQVASGAAPENRGSRSGENSLYGVYGNGWDECSIVYSKLSLVHLCWEPCFQ